jgi:hypothetical protein
MKVTQLEDLRVWQKSRALAGSVSCHRQELVHVRTAMSPESFGNVRHV